MPGPWNKITIARKVLKDLYENQGLSIAQIASKLHCSVTPIQRMLREYRLKIRTLSEANEKYDIPKKELRNLYFKQKLSMSQIAQNYGCNHVTILNRFEKYELKSRGHLGLRKPIKILKKKLEYLYHEKELSAAKIAKVIHCTTSGVERKLQIYNIKTRSVNQRACKYKKKDFDGTPEEKSYMLGFRLGDLSVYRPKNIICVRCSTTYKGQISLIKKLFEKYGGIYSCFAPRGTYEICCFLNNSFEFLLPKEDRIPNWILKNNRYFLAFWAGYSDAEGSLYIRNPTNKSVPFAVFEISSYDKNILFQAWEKLKTLAIYCSPPWLKTPRGTPCGNKKYKANGDAWCVTIAQKASLWKLLHLWESYSRHDKKKKAIHKAKENIILRNKLPYCHKIDLSISELPS